MPLIVPIVGVSPGKVLFKWVLLVLLWGFVWRALLGAVVVGMLGAFFQQGWLGVVIGAAIACAWRLIVIIRALSTQQTIAM